MSGMNLTRAQKHEQAVQRTMEHIFTADYADWPAVMLEALARVVRCRNDGNSLNNKQAGEWLNALHGLLTKERN